MHGKPVTIHLDMWVHKRLEVTATLIKSQFLYNMNINKAIKSLKQLHALHTCCHGRHQFLSLAILLLLLQMGQVIHFCFSLQSINCKFSILQNVEMHFDNTLKQSQRILNAMAMDIPLHSYRLVQEYPIQLIKLQFNPYQEATLGEMDRGKKKKNSRRTHIRTFWSLAT